MVRRNSHREPGGARASQGYVNDWSIESVGVRRTLNIWMKGCGVHIAIAFTTAPLKDRICVSDKEFRIAVPLTSEQPCRASSGLD